MKTLSFKFTSSSLLRCVFLSLLWSVIDSNTTSKPNVTLTGNALTSTKAAMTRATQMPTTSTAKPATNVNGVTVTKQDEASITQDEKIESNTTSQTNSTQTEMTQTTITTTPLPVTSTTKSRPNNVLTVNVTKQNEITITLTWDKVEDISTYMLQFISIDTLKVQDIYQPVGEVVTHVVSGLSPGIKYNFTLYTVSDGLNSTGRTFEAATAPSDAKDFKSVDESETSITLQWKKVADMHNYTLTYDGEEISIDAQEEDETIMHTISNLRSGTLHIFTLFTVFETIQSSGVSLNASTAPLNAEGFKSDGQTETSINLVWDRVGDILNYVLLFNESEINVTAVTHTMPNLTAATLYNFTLFTVFENVRSSGVNLTAPTAPRNADDFKSATQTETSITLQWSLTNILNYTLVFNETIISNIIATEEQETMTYEVSHLTSGTLYNFTLFTVFENIKSSGETHYAGTVPRNAEGFKVKSQNESSITLQWKKVAAIPHYTLVFSERNESVNATEENENVTHTISDLSSGTLYMFTLFTEFETLKSSGANYSAATVPPAVASVRVTERHVTGVILEWENVRKDWSYFLTINDTTVLVIPDGSSNVVSHSVTFLEPGTEYSFSMITTFYELNSTAYQDSTLTTIDCNSVDWQVTTSSIQGRVQGLVSNATATNGSHTHTSPGANNVSFTDLYPGANYEMHFVYEKNSTNYTQCRHNLTIIPPRFHQVECKNWAAGYSIYIDWVPPDGVWSAVEVNVTGQKKLIIKNGEEYAELSGFQPAKTYEVSIGSVSGSRRSDPHVFPCSTDPRGVIAGSVMAVLLFAVLVCLAVFIVLKRPHIISKNSFIRGSKLPNKKNTAIPVENFPSHFDQLNADENRGFSEEYESLGTVGTEQTRKAALLLDNKAKNRFTNVLPYDWCRVKLNTSNPDCTDDYINASYMPGYNSRREYIASQGPLPSTVNDFWKMIWEQRVKGIVMVTNCTEGGRTKCERYWPEDKEPSVYGQLTTILTSEQQEPSWTLREFRLKHRQTSEERTVKHFHFTAWPDHGVPEGTEVLIQFRRLLRHHIQTEAAGTPTVVHCSAGVGRTGTIIALDVLLQQLEKEKAVDINGFVYKMRLSRPHMVQTESQYVFLHHCIMDSLQPNDRSGENIYENADMIYANATALRELH